MKKLLIAVLILFLFIACGNNGNKKKKKDYRLSQQPKEVLQCQKKHSQWVKAQ